MAKKKIGITRNEAILLYGTIRDIKNGALSREALVKYVMFRVKLKSLFEEFEKVRQEISEQTKPEGWKEGDSYAEWDERFRSSIEAWLKEPSGIEAAVFTQDECIDLIASNPDLPGTASDQIVSLLCKQ